MIASSELLEVERRNKVYKCPKCKKNFDRLLAVSRIDNKTMICDDCGVREALDAAGLPEGSSVRKAIINARKISI